MTEFSQSLLDIIATQAKADEPAEIDPKLLRYAVYARKSTESADRQARSIPDQIKDCFEFVINPEEITIKQKDIFKEERSAKEAGTRPEFRRMIQAIEDGKYDGIISWHPDRIARNMKEAGEIIDLIDRNIIKDLRFAKANFENTATGKMMLGISFVLSKHYSEHLSESVNRGNKRITERGAVLNHQKHGYRLLDHKLIADDTNYILIQKAFDMRRTKATQKQIADFLNKSSYQVYRQGEHHSYKFDEDAVSNMLRDPIYAGIVVYGKSFGEISENDPEFTPMLSEEEFLEINGVRNFFSARFRASAEQNRETSMSDFLRQSVVCGHCGRYMTTSTPSTMTKGEKVYYFRFRCDNKGVCKFYGTGPRGYVVIDYVFDFLAKHEFTTETNYEKYKHDIEAKLRFDTEENERILKQATTILANKERAFDVSRNAAADPDNPAHGYYTAHDLKVMETEIKALKREIKQARDKKDRQTDALVSYSDFLELFGNTVDLLGSTSSMALADEIIRIFFLNFTVMGSPKGKSGKQKQWSVTAHQLQKPFRDFVENQDFLDGRGDRT
jgi:DNA invertase Pin-like site-specific DNA recombinase